MNSIGIIGLGTIGMAVAQGLHQARPQLEILGTRRKPAPARDFVTLCGDNRELVNRTRMVVLCVKPQQAAAVLEEIRPALKAEHILISTCAGMTLDAISQIVPSIHNIARAMPNIACELNQGVTAISGCGPAYVCVIIEAMTDAGVKQGLPREAARLLVTQTLLGSAQLVLQSHQHPAQIRDRVSTPGGCTIDALTALEDGKLRMTLISAVTAAATKSATLANGARLG